LFFTHFLFSSASLRFSEAQKHAILGWAKALKAPDVPSLYAVKKMGDRVEKLVGDPTVKIVSASGNIFYMNKVHTAIARDYANPLTRFAMSDYARDRGKGMSQVQNGKKMMVDVPSQVSSPAVRVNGQIFFSNELLCCIDGSLFIPTHFHYGADKKSSLSL
ncbi:hypothetical protein BC628DRAFT_1287413, partial [Trametes gibbosa]